MVVKKKKKEPVSGPPDFVKLKGSVGADSGLAERGIELSKTLPTYDVPIDLIEPNDWNVNVMGDKAEGGSIVKAPSGSVVLISGSVLPSNCCG